MYRSERSVSDICEGISYVTLLLKDNQVLFTILNI